MQLILEATLVGVISVILGSIIARIVTKLLPSNVDMVTWKREGWNDKHQMEITLFVLGFVGHLFCEFVGLNRWYCANGAACKV